MKTSIGDDWASIYHVPDEVYAMHFLTNPFATAKVNGLITPLTQPSSGASCYNETFTPLEEMQMQGSENQYSAYEQAGYGRQWAPQQQDNRQHPPQQSYFGKTSFSTDRSSPFAYTSAQDAYVGTAPSTPNLFPASNSSAAGDSEAPISSNQDDKVLVGMGLYDAPPPVQRTHFSGDRFSLPHRGSAGKGLKLEETFEPSNEDDGDDEGSEEQEAEGDDSNAELDSVTNYPTSQPLEESQTQPAPPLLSGQSFLFDQDPDEAQYLQQTYGEHFTAPIWTDVYTGAPYQWI
jgi:hypothetical protein